MRTRIRLVPLAAATAFAWAGAAASASAAAPVTHTVSRGETLTSIAAQDGLSIAQIAVANGLSTSAELIAGTALVIPPATAVATSDAVVSSVPAAPAQTSTASATSAGGFVVPRGDTLSAIAVRFGTTTDALAQANGMSVDGLLLAGRTLEIPAAGVTEVGTAAPAPVQSAASAPAPVSQFVAPSEVGEIAAEDGVPAELAEAIADQESGFNDDEVSSTGAVGVMQIEPATWQDLERLDGLELDSGSAVDNVRGGVALLRSLLAATGGDESQAIAAYYQGLQSIRTRGLFADTRHYVSDVLALEPRFGG